MDLLDKYLQGKSHFSSYDDFCKNFKLSLPKNFNFARDVVDFYAENAPDQIALVWCNDENEEKILTFGQLARESLKAAAFLSAQGIKEGDVVVLSLHRRYEYWIFIIALHRLAALVLPLPSQLVKEELVFRLKESKARMIIAAPFEDSVEQLELAAKKQEITLVSVAFAKEPWIDYSKAVAAGFPEPVLSAGNTLSALPVDSASCPMLLYFTSGTRGNPKMVLHNYLYPLSHIITAKYWQCVQDGGLHFSIAETGWAKASWGKIYGQWLAGSAVFVYDRQNFNPERILEKMAKYKVTSFCANPTVYRYLLNVDFSAYDLSALKHCTSAGEALSLELSEQFYKKNGLKIYQGYGQSETALLAAEFCFENKEEQEEKGQLSMGKASPLYDLQLEKATGEIVINLNAAYPPGLLMGYYKDKKLTEEVFCDSLYHTGDLAWQANDGSLYFIGRKDDMIKSSGFRISPYEVENVLIRHPAVFECAVTGEKDEIRGQIVTALVRLAPGYEASKNMERELISYMHKNIARYKSPRKIEFVKELPKTYNGKILRARLKEEKREE